MRASQRLILNYLILGTYHLNRWQKLIHILISNTVAMTDQIPEKTLPKVPTWIYQ